MHSLWFVATTTRLLRGALGFAAQRPSSQQPLSRCFAARRRKTHSVVAGPFEVGEELEVKIDSLTNLGHGVARYEGESDEDERSGVVILIPYVIPGETVVCRVWRNHKQHASADLVRVVDPSPERVAPRCSLYGDCGGCQYQHMSLTSQREWKKNHLEEALTRLAGAPGIKVEETQGGDAAYGYRTKLTPHYDKPKEDGELRAIGFNGARFKIVDVENCPIATDQVNEKLGDVRREMRDRTRWMVDAFQTGRSKKKPKGGTILLRHHERGVATDHNEVVSERVNGIRFKFKANDFWQNNANALPKLVEHVRLETSRNGDIRFLVDCYCGGGLFALTSADKFEGVFGIEISESSVRSAQANARSNNITNVEFQADSAEAIFDSVLHLPPEQTAVILDPPRKGASLDFLEQLTRFAPAVVVYVSCDPATQARDANILLENGYQITKAVPFDLFPQTRHIESVLTFARHSSSP